MKGKEKDAAKGATGSTSTATTTTLVISTNTQPAKEEKANTANNTKPEAKPELPAKSETGKPSTAPVTIKTIVEKTEKLNKLLQRRAGLDNVVKQLDSFNLGSDKLHDRLTIEDSDGNQFTTSKTNLIEEIVILLKAKAESEYEKTEAEILELATA